MGPSDLRYRKAAPRPRPTGPGSFTLRKLGTNLFLAVTIVSMVFVNMPESELEDVLDRPVYVYTSVTGLAQNWGVFAPNPRRISLDMYATVTFEDGSQARWETPRWGPLIGAYRHYRWRKWMTNVRLDDNEGELWEPTAGWIARRFSDRGEVIKVTLVRRFRDVPAPGEVTPEWEEFAFYTLELET